MRSFLLVLNITSHSSSTLFTFTIGGLIQHKKEAFFADNDFVQKANLTMLISKAQVESLGIYQRQHYAANTNKPIKLESFVTLELLDGQPSCGDVICKT